MKYYIVKKEEIQTMAGLNKVHFLNSEAKRNNKSLGDLTGLTGIGFHIIEIQPGCYSSEYHVHHFENECVYILEGRAIAIIGEDEFEVEAGDFIGYRAGGLAHCLINRSEDVLRAIVVGQRLAHDVGDYPNLKKRLYRNEAMEWDMVDLDNISHPKGGQK